jgi:excisionase family DNA binding protein
MEEKRAERTMVDVKWVAKRIGVRPNTIYRMLAAKTLPIPAMRLGRRVVRFDPQKVEEYIAKQFEKNTAAS